MTKTTINITKFKPNAILPDYQTVGAAGMDVHACIEKSIILKPMERQLIPTGIAIELPIGFEAQIRARSSMGFKFGIALVNGIGTIDSDYRGEIGVTLINLSQQDFVIEPNMRIAQMIIASHEKVVWSEVKSLGDTVRGSGGFGSTGNGVNN